MSRTTHSARTSVAPALPQAFVDDARAWLGDETDAFLAACARPPRLTLRPNEAKGGLARLLPLLSPEAARWPRVSWWPTALLPPADHSAGLAAGLPAAIGALYAQDPSALAAVAALDPQPGERILDLCAAPGGKSTAILDRLGDSGLLVANDIDRRRAADLSRTLAAWGTSRAVVTACAGDKLAALVPHFFDRVLVDAPCSGEAMFGRHAAAARDWSPHHVAGCAARQRRLLNVARLLVRDGGILVYSTCTFNPTEDEGIVGAYLDDYPRDGLDDVRRYVPDAASGRPDLVLGDERVRHCGRLWPHMTPGAGHFVARLRVDHGPDAAERSPGRSLTRDREQVEDAAQALGAARAAAPGFPALDACSPIVRSDDVYLAAPDAPATLIARSRVPGLHVATRRGRTWRPAPALAYVLTPDEARAAVDIDDPEALLAGHPVPCRPHASGIALATTRGYPLGWVRVRDQTATLLTTVSGKRKQFLM